MIAVAHDDFIGPDGAFQQLGTEPDGMNPNPSDTTTITIGCKTFTLNNRPVEQYIALETHSTPWHPAGATLARLVDVTMIGIPADGPTRSSIGASLQSISALSYLYNQAVVAGRRKTAILDGSLLLAEVEKLAAAGSEDAAASLMIVADMFRRDDHAEEVFAAAAGVSSADTVVPDTEAAVGLHGGTDTDTPN